MSYDEMWAEAERRGGFRCVPPDLVEVIKQFGRSCYLAGKQEERREQDAIRVFLSAPADQPVF